MQVKKHRTIGVIGLGYVGLPVALAFAKKYTVVGFDINNQRINELRRGDDSTGEVSGADIRELKTLHLTCHEKALKSCDVFIVTVPTPVDAKNQPDFRPLVAASECVARQLKPRDIVVYESTVYPGATEEICVPVLEKLSGLGFNQDFFVGYSPERINPGDSSRSVNDIIKVTSGSTPDAAFEIDRLYDSVIDAGTYLASSIKVAEAAKVIENVQRDVNIALINELAILFSKLEINSQSVFNAAKTKWNFLPFTPGLVGGHCIGVDPYYLLNKSESVGFKSLLISSARQVNEGMHEYAASKLAKEMVAKNKEIIGARVLIFGYTFKPNCPDTRNTGVRKFIQEIKSYGMLPAVYDPMVQESEKDVTTDFDWIEVVGASEFDAIVYCVNHELFGSITDEDLVGFCAGRKIVFDLTGERDSICSIRL